MAKAKKKSSPAKVTKPASKPAPKLAKGVKKPMAAKAAPTAKKAVPKPAKAAPPKKAAAKAPVKAAPPAPAKKATPVKGKEKPVKKPVAIAKPEKKVTAEKAEKELKKTAAPESAPAKKEGKATAAKKGKSSKKEEAEAENDFVSESEEDFGGDEMREYEEDLKAVEELDEEAVEDEAWAAETKEKGDEEVILTDAEGRRYCRARDCDQVGAVDGYCRFHYLLFWKKIQVRKKILADGKLVRYVEELTSRYPDKFLEMIRRDLRTEKDFLAAIQELEIDENVADNEFEEDTSAFIEEVRGMGEGGNSGVEEEEF